MKIIHCADIHLGSSLTSYKNKEVAKIRKDELLRTFSDMINYASNNDVDAIIIAGDLFDKDNGIKRIKDYVFKLIEDHKSIEFYYLRGNHDNFDLMINKPDNLYLFEDKWTSYNIKGDENITITGLELNENTSSIVYQTLDLDKSKFNIVTLHGQISGSINKKDGEIIDLKLLKNKNIDYLALGHIHSYTKEKLDARGIYVYPGCLEARGFDEIGDHGFVMIDTNESSEFIKFSKRNILNKEIDISNINNNYEIIKKIKTETSNINKEDILHISLNGNVDILSDINIEFIEEQIKDDFFYLRVKDNTRLQVNYDDYMLEESLKGEFVRTVRNDNSLTEEEKAEIIKIGIDALTGGEI